MVPMDYMESCCCFDASLYTGTPDTQPCPKAVDVPDLIQKLDALYEAGKEAEAGILLDEMLLLSRNAGDWRAELSLLGEQCGQCRRSGEREKALAAIARILQLIREHRMGSTVSAATTLLNAATTLKCFGMARQSLPFFEQVSRVYGKSLDPSDYRFAGLFNNMALSYADVGEYGKAESLFRAAMKVIEHCEKPQNELAVSLCNLAELYYKQDVEDARVDQCMEQAWVYLNDPALPKDGYHAFTISKCAPSFEYFGFFLYAKELKERAAKIYALS